MFYLFYYFIFIYYFILLVLSKKQYVQLTDINAMNEQLFDGYTHLEKSQSYATETKVDPIHKRKIETMNDLLKARYHLKRASSGSQREIGIQKSASHPIELGKRSKTILAAIPASKTQSPLVQTVSCVPNDSCSLSESKDDWFLPFSCANETQKELSFDEKERDLSGNDDEMHDKVQSIYDYKFEHEVSFFIQVLLVLMPLPCLIY